MSRRSLRSSDRAILVLPESRLVTIDSKASSIRAPRLWNRLPEENRLANSVFSFKYLFYRLAFIWCVMSIYIYKLFTCLLFYWDNFTRPEPVFMTAVISIVVFIMCKALSNLSFIKYYIYSSLLSYMPNKKLFYLCTNDTKTYSCSYYNCQIVFLILI